MRNGAPLALRRSGPLLLLVSATALAALAVTLLLLSPAAFAQLYGDLLYPALSSLFATLTSWTQVPLGLATLPILCGIFLWRTLVTGRRPATRALTFRLVQLAVLLLSLYTITWGANYRRPDLLGLLDVPARQVTQAELDAFSDELLAWVVEAAAELDQADRTGDALVLVAEELEQLSLELGWPATVPSKVKLLPAGTLLRSGYAGMLFPFTLEAQLDSGLAPVSRVAIGAHELAHAAGFANETDADLAALIAGLRTDDALARYAIALSLLSRSLESLSPQQRTFVVSNLPVRALRDLATARDASARYLNSSLARRVTAIYHRLLKGQGVESGVDAYRLAPALGALLADEGLLPPPPLTVRNSGVDERERPTPALPVGGSPVPQLLATLGR